MYKIRRSRTGALQFDVCVCTKSVTENAGLMKKPAWKKGCAVILQYMMTEELFFTEMAAGVKRKRMEPTA